MNIQGVHKIEFTTIIQAPVLLSSIQTERDQPCLVQIYLDVLCIPLACAWFNQCAWNASPRNLLVWFDRLLAVFVVELDVVAIGEAWMCLAPTRMITRMAAPAILLWSNEYAKNVVAIEVCQ